MERDGEIEADRVKNEKDLLVLEIRMINPY